MRAHRGQIALFLAMAMLAAAVLAFLVFNTFLAVRAKNRMMNAVDEAAITAARYQGYLLNEIGRMNVEHLRMAVLGNERWSKADSSDPDDRLVRMRELALFGPLKALEMANGVTKDWYGEEPDVDEEAKASFYDHIAEILGNPDIYPTDDGLWRRYAEELRSAISSAGAVLPYYMELARPVANGLFANHCFYDVLSSKAWCWFTVGNRSQYLDGDDGSATAALEALASPENSEIFSLHVSFLSWADSQWGDAFDEEWTNFVCQVTGLSREDFSPRSYVTDPTEVWAFYDDNWKKWSATFNPTEFPISGSVRAEYDVAGCVASCAMIAGLPHMETKEDTVTRARTMRVTAEAKPLGTVRGLDGSAKAPVTAYRRFIAASHPDRQIFTEAQLVLMGSVPRSPGVSCEPDWYRHILNHGQNPAPGCGYCSLWRQWCDDSYRSSIRDWIRNSGDSCHPSTGDGPEQRGGYDWGH